MVYSFWKWNIGDFKQKKKIYPNTLKWGWDEQDKRLMILEVVRKDTEKTERRKEEEKQ